MEYQYGGLPLLCGSSLSVEPTLSRWWQITRFW
jgi:hypothetical protein